jgi:hypothetical protein
MAWWKRAGIVLFAALLALATAEAGVLALSAGDPILRRGGLLMPVASTTASYWFALLLVIDLLFCMALVRGWRELWR